MFSVIVPTYNREALLPEALASIFRQTFKDYELIVIDDGSTDSTWKYLQSLGSSVIPLKQANAGPGAARNLGASHASGKYLTFLDSDDLWFPWTLAIYAQAISQAREPAVVSGKGLAKHERVNGDEKGRFQNYLNLFAATDNTMLPVGGTPSVAVNRLAFERVGGFVKSHLNGEDVDLWLRLGAESGFVRVLSPPVFEQRYFEETASRNLSAQVGGILHLLNQEKSGSYPGGIACQARRQEVISSMARSISIECIQNRNCWAAFVIYFQSFALQFRRKRFKYLLMFPAFALRALFRTSLNRSRG